MVMRDAANRVYIVLRSSRDFLRNNLDLFQFFTALAGSILLLVQIHQALIAYRADIQNRLISHSLEILKVVRDSPELYDYIYLSKDPATASLSKDKAKKEPATASLSKDKAKVEVLALMYLDLFEHMCLQSNGLASNTSNSWKSWALDVLNSSPAIRNRLETKNHWYSGCVNELLQMSHSRIADP